LPWWFSAYDRLGEEVGDTNDAAVRTGRVRGGRSVERARQFAPVAGRKRMLLAQLAKDLDHQLAHPVPALPVRGACLLEQEGEGPLVVAGFECLEQLGLLARCAQLLDQHPSGRRPDQPVED